MHGDLRRAEGGRKGGCSTPSVILGVLIYPLKIKIFLVNGVKMHDFGIKN